MNASDWISELDTELRQNILPFWLLHAWDEKRGGFIGGMNGAGEVLDFPRSTVLISRILWTFSAAARRFPEPTYRQMADRAYHALINHHFDPVHGGVFGAVDSHGVAVHRRKLTYAQAFGIYGLSEYFLLTQEPSVLLNAQSLFRFIETHVADHELGGYREGCAEDGSPDHLAQISTAEPETRKSMNTLLHVLEAYTNLLRAWPHPTLKERQAQLLEVMLTRVIDPATGHFHMYFREDWSPLGDRISYGHDIEGAWLIREAAHVLGDSLIDKQTVAASLGLARGVLSRGFLKPGHLGFEGDLQGVHDRSLHWWVHAEAMVGFYDAYQLSGESPFRTTAEECWTAIQRIFVDRNGGDWYKVLNEKGTPSLQSLKIGPWECPYHHARTCFEMMDRLSVSPGSE